MAIFFTGYGIIAIFFRDTAWEIDEFMNDIGGRESKRTEAWEVGSVVVGVISIIFGIIAIYAGLTYDL